MEQINLDSYITNITNLNPLLESKFMYDSKRWAKLNPLYKKLISDFEDKSICRADVIHAFKEYYSSQGDAMRAFRTLDMARIEQIHISQCHPILN